MLTARKTPKRETAIAARSVLGSTLLLWVVWASLLGGAIPIAGGAGPSETGVVESDLGSMSLGDLLRQRPELYVDSNTASGVSETIRDAPASMLVVDAQSIKRRGYDSLDDLLEGLPGFDTITAAGTMQTVAYQRGYRSPWTQRTLLLVNGKVENNLWNHSAQISRQYPMSIVERVEVLHGPAGAVYGPNAFLGVVNVVTRDSSRLKDGAHRAEASVIWGDYDSRGVDIALGGRKGAFSYDLGLKLYDSDEAGIDDYSEWGFTDESLLSDPDRWGPGIGVGVDPVSGNDSPAGDLDVDGQASADEIVFEERLGQYSDPTSNYGFVGEARLGDWELGIVRWRTDEGYGPYYSFADAQPGVPWTHESSQIYVNHDTELFGRVSLASEVVYRTSRVGGLWAESFGDNVSLSSWNSYNESWRMEERLTYSPSEELTFSGGVRYEHRDLSKLYFINNYWEGAGASGANGGESSSSGSAVLPADQITSENPTVVPPAIDPNSIADSNLWRAQDYGAFVQGIWDRGDWRMSSSVRWDENSNFDSVVSPRLALVHHSSSRTSFKIAYGEAFQEPSPKDLFGGWNGRASNPGLLSERARNLELMMTCQADAIMHGLSLFTASYCNVIAGAENVGGRDVWGIEYKSNFRVPNFLPNSNEITGSFFYTYTDSRADMQYNNATGVWDPLRAATGDIAPHKVNFTVNLPVRRHWNANVAANWISDRKLFSQNPLRADSNPDRMRNRDAESYLKVNAHFLYERDRYRLGFKIENLLEEEYLLPGVEAAASGDDFSRDFDGFQNSLIPQVKERVYTLFVTLKI